MAKTAEQVKGTTPVYSLEGTLLEACSCNVLCPCWIGEDPDLGDCRGLLSYHIDQGTIQGTDVSGMNLVLVVHIPGNVLAGNIDAVLIVDDRATPEQRDALVAAVSGQLGGPMADLASLIGTVKGIDSGAISHRVEEGVGTLSIDGVLEANMEPYRGPSGDVTTLQNSIFSTIPGSPAWVSKASRNQLSLPKYGWEWEFEGRNAIQADWKMEHFE